MARSIFTWSSGEIALVANTRKGILGMSGSANYVRAILKRFGMSTNGLAVAAANKPVYCRLCATPAALAAGTSLTANKRKRHEYDQVGGSYYNSTAPFCSAKQGFTVPTTNVQVLREGEIHPNGGLWEPYPFDFGDEPELVNSDWSLWFDALGDTVLSVSAWADIEE